MVQRWQWTWPLATGTLWVLQEALRDRTPFGGFPWGRLAFSQGDSPLLLNTSYTITADIEVPQGGAEGMILTSGGRFAGYGLYLLKGKPVFLWNLVDLERPKWEGPDALTPGRHTIEFDFKYDGPGFGKGGTGTLSVDGKEVATKSLENTIPITVPEDEAFDVGMDTRTPVALIEYHYDCPFKFTGKIERLTFHLGPHEFVPVKNEEKKE